MKDDIKHLVALPPSERQHLRREAKRRIVEAARLLHNNDIDSAGENLRWVEHANKILVATARPPRKLFFAAVVAGFCVLLAGLMLGVPMWSNGLRLDVQSHALSFNLTQAWQQRNMTISATNIRADNLANIEIQGVIHKNGAYELDLDNAVLRITALAISDNAHVDIDHQSNGFTLTVKHGQLSGELQITQADVTLHNEADTVMQTISEETGAIMRFISTQTSEMPITFSIATNDVWRLDGWQVSAIQFNRPDPPSSNNWISTIKQGELALLDTGQTTKLHQADQLKIANFRSTRFSVAQDNTLIEGRAQRVDSGPKDHLTRRSPTILEYLYHQQQLALFWSSVLFLWGMFWSVRNLL